MSLLSDCANASQMAVTHVVLLKNVVYLNVQTMAGTLANNSAIYWCILKIPSPTESAVNLQQSGYWRSNQTLNVLVHYLVKYKEIQKVNTCTNCTLQLIELISLWILFTKSTFISKLYHYRKTHEGFSEQLTAFLGISAEQDLWLLQLVVLQMDTCRHQLVPPKKTAYR